MHAPDNVRLWKSEGLPEVLTRERCHVSELLNDKRLPEASLARARVEPGVSTELHSLSVEEKYILEAGIGLMELDGKSFEVTSGDIVVVSAGASQRITNVGETDLIFLCLCLPRFTPDCYKPLGDK